MASLLNEVMQRPEKIRAYMKRLDTLEQAIASAERTALTKPAVFTDTASGSYSQAELQAVMDQVESLTTTQRQLLDLVALVLSDFREAR